MNIDNGRIDEVMVRLGFSRGIGGNGGNRLYLHTLVRKAKAFVCNGDVEISTGGKSRGGKGHFMFL